MTVPTQLPSTILQERGLFQGYYAVGPNDEEVMWDDPTATNVCSLSAITLAFEVNSTDHLIIDDEGTKHWSKIFTDGPFGQFVVALADELNDNDQKDDDEDMVITSWNDNLEYDDLSKMSPEQQAIEMLWHVEQKLGYRTMEDTP